MEPLMLTERKTPRKDLATGIGASILVHMLIFSTAFICTLVMPHTPLTPPYCTVNLVSLKDLGSGSSEPKGHPKATEDAGVHKEAASPGRSRQKVESAVPIKRLAVDETAIRPEPQIKKIEPKEVPTAQEKARSLDTIEKNLDKLIAKPKVIPHTTPTASAEQTEPKPKAPQPPQAHAAEPKPSPPSSTHTPAKNETAEGEKIARGTPSGAAEGGSKGAAQGSSFGSPDGSGAISAAAQLYYERVRNAIRQEFRLPDQSIGNLETRVFMAVSKNGQILGFQVEKSSGNGLLDAAAVRAIQNANIPAMPPALDRSKQDFRITFNSRGVS